MKISDVKKGDVLKVTKDVPPCFKAGDVREVLEDWPVEGQLYLKSGCGKHYLVHMECDASGEIEGLERA